MTRTTTTMTASMIHVDSHKSMPDACKALTQGEILVIPTETIYGLTCDAENLVAVSRLFGIKGRSLERVSAVFLPDLESITRHAEQIEENALSIMKRFLPGPLTVVLKCKQPHWPGVVGDDGKIGIRVSSYSFVQELSANLGRPLIATSANLSGESDVIELEDIKQVFADHVALIIYRDEPPRELPSTVVDLTGSQPRLLREGAIPFAKILEFANGTKRD